MGRKKPACIVGLSGDFHLNKKDSVVHLPFPSANRVADSEVVTYGWVRADQDYVFWDYEFPPTASSDLTTKEGKAYTSLPVEEGGGKLPLSLIFETLQTMVDGHLQFVVKDKFRLSRNKDIGVAQAILECKPAM